MKVVLKQDWIGPNGHRYRRSKPNSFTVIPDELVGKLPKESRVKGADDAQVIREADTPEGAPEPELARDADPNRADEAEILARIAKARAKSKAPAE